MTPPHTSSIHRGTQSMQRNGFALIATISVMVLLVMIALAMLSLSTIEMRASRQGQAMSEARANARLALMLAIGELQKAAGPDQRITATADVLGGNSQWPKLVGVWRSWEGSLSKFDPGNRNARVPIPPPHSYAQAKENRFLTWLTSHPDAASYSLPTTQPIPAGSGPIAPGYHLVDINSSGSADKKTGSYSWIVYDEGVKAKLASLKCCIPQGIPIMVMQSRNPNTI